MRIVLKVSGVTWRTPPSWMWLMVLLFEEANFVTFSMKEDSEIELMLFADSRKVKVLLLLLLDDIFVLFVCLFVCFL